MATESRSASAAGIIIPADVIEAARRTIGVYFAPISKADPEANIKDFLDLSKSLKRAEIVQRYTPLCGKKLLEVGSGFGTNLAVWINHFDVDGYGIEPGGEGFNEGYAGSLKVLAANGIDTSRVRNAFGETLPFPDETFDIVYSANVLEHTGNPEKVLAESFRVLKNGGILHMEMPNFLSYFEGHYLVFQPPIFWRPLLPWLVRYVYRRDPTFAKTLRTQINPLWCKRTIRRIAAAMNCRLELISLGEEIFLERLSQAFRFETQIVAVHLRPVVAALQKLNFRNWVGRLIIALRGHYPIYLTVRKNCPGRTDCNPAA